MRGDDNSSATVVPASPGTPPRARGRRRLRAGRRGAGRNTPACAGTTRCWTSGRWCPTEHPRVRGDDSEGGSPNSDSPGTPPRARGRLLTDYDTMITSRNTPACAGTTDVMSANDRPTQEHPRVRGDDHRSPREFSAGCGTPPRARGRPQHARRRHAAARNTPACAGTTRGSADMRIRQSEHPRVRGDDTVPAALAHTHAGTPPRARGRRTFRKGHPGQHGNTPACAGTT